MSAAPYQPKSEALRMLYWREEILQVMFWIKGEGFGERVGLEQLSRFLGLDSDIGLRYVDRLVLDGYLHSIDGQLVLSEKGHAEGMRIFADEFADVTKPSHGECGLDCWCRSSASEAAACNAEYPRTSLHT
jgi:hypothetical protein